MTQRTVVSTSQRKSQHDQHPNHQQQDTGAGTSLVETGLSLLGLGSDSPHMYKSPKKAPLHLMKVHHDPTDDFSDAVSMHDLDTIDNAAAKRKKGGGWRGATRTHTHTQTHNLSGSRSMSTKGGKDPSVLVSNDASGKGACFVAVASDAPTVGDDEHLRSRIEAFHKFSNKLNHNRNGNGNGITSKTKRRLQWRVGPLVKLKKPKPKTRKKRSGRGEDEMSLTERTVKSFHTQHSTETIQAGNKPGGQGGFRSQSPGTGTGISTNLTMMSPQKSKRKDHRNHIASSPTSIAYDPNGDVEEKDDNLSDGGTVVVSYDDEEELSRHAPQKTIGLFLFDNESHNHSHNRARNTATRQKSMGKGLPPRAPYVPHYVTSAGGRTTDEQGGGEFAPPSYYDNHEDGGPLWQLAKLQAISEGISSKSSSSLFDEDDESSPTKISKKSLKRFFSFSNKNQSGTGSVSGDSVSTSSSSKSELQRIQAERNLKAIHRLVSQHLSYNEYDEAIEVLEEMLRGVKEMYGERHYRVGTVLHNISTVHMRRRDYAKVVQVSRQAVEMRMKALGSIHPDVAISYAQLGMAHMELEEYHYAVLAFQNALVIRRKTLSFRDEKIARILNNIGCCLFELEKLKEAATAFQESLSIQRLNMKNAGAPNLDVGMGDVSHHLLSIASTLCNLGSIQLRLKQCDEASVFLDEALLIQQSVLGDGHPTVKNTKDSIEFVNETRSSNFGNRAIQGLTDKMQQVRLQSGGNKEGSTNIKVPSKFTIPSPMGLFTDVMSLNGAEWVQVFEDIGGAPILPLCKGCTQDLDDATVPSHQTASLGKDLHWI